VTSFINIRYCNVAIESIPQGTAFCYVFCGQRTCANTIHCEMQCMVTVVLRDQQYMFGVKSLLMVEKVMLMKNLVAMLFRRTDAMIAAVNSHAV